jgi:hypothetical protein
MRQLKLRKNLEEIGKENYSWEPLKLVKRLPVAVRIPDINEWGEMLYELRDGHHRLYLASKKIPIPPFIYVYARNPTTYEKNVQNIVKKVNIVNKETTQLLDKKKKVYNIPLRNKNNIHIT